jgi:hypothetical protein
MGDSSGCVSIWRVAKPQSGGSMASIDPNNQKPLFIITSPSQAEESVENIEWNSEGNTLIINYIKKYVGIVHFPNL